MKNISIYINEVNRKLQLLQDWYLKDPRCNIHYTTYELIKENEILFMHLDNNFKVVGELYYTFEGITSPEIKALITKFKENYAMEWLPFDVVNEIFNLRRVVEHLKKHEPKPEGEVL